MAADVQVEFIGLDEIIDKLSGNMVRDMTGRIVRKAAIEGENQGKQLAPVDTGNLRTSMTHHANQLQGWFGTNRRYGLYLDQPVSRDPTYRGGPFSGSGTAGWLTEKAREQVRSKMDEFMQQEIRTVEREWSS